MRSNTEATTNESVLMNTEEGKKSGKQNDADERLLYDFSLSQLCKAPDRGGSRPCGIH